MNSSNTFSEVKVGDIIYWTSINCDHIHSTIVTGQNIELDGTHSPEFCEIKFSTNDGIEFSICKYLTKAHNCVAFTKNDNNSTIYVGTSKEIVAKTILNEINKKIKILQNHKERFIENFHE